VMYRSRYYCSTFGKRLLFSALIQPHFMYCIELWRCGNQSVIPIGRGGREILYRHFRVVLGDIGYRPVLSNWSAYVLSNYLPLSLEFQLRGGCLLYAILKGNTISHLRYIFQAKVNSQCTCDSVDVLRLQIPFSEPNANV
jgi:hypothetical protein